VRRNWVVAAVATVVAAIVVAVVLVWARDDGSGRIETTAWAGSVCTSLSDWRSSITSLADVSGGTLNAESLRQKLDDAEAATETLVTDLRGLGTPDLDAGAEVEQALDDAADGLERSYRSLQQAAEAAVEAESSEDFLQELATLGADYQRLLEQVADTVATLQSASLFGEASAELEQAFADAESCQALRGENG
jgi:dGTP triphosphohydrolase